MKNADFFVLFSNYENSLLLFLKVCFAVSRYQLRMLEVLRSILMKQTGY
jgi:hypothetical protein